MVGEEHVERHDQERCRAQSLQQKPIMPPVVSIEQTPPSPHLGEA